MVTTLQTFMPLSYLKGSEQITLRQHQREKRRAKVLGQGRASELDQSSQLPTFKLVPSPPDQVLATVYINCIWILRLTHSFGRKQASKLVRAFCVSCTSQSNVLSHKAIQKKNFKPSLTYSAPAAVSSRKNSWLA